MHRYNESKMNPHRLLTAVPAVMLAVKYLIAQKCFSSLSEALDLPRFLALYGPLTRCLFSLLPSVIQQSIPAVAKVGCAAIAALCLRVPENAAAFVANSVAPLLIDILKNHQMKVSIEVTCFLLA